MNAHGVRFQDTCTYVATYWDQSICNFGCATGLADLGQLYIRLSSCATGLIDPGQLYIGLPGCTIRLTHYISGSVLLCNRASLSSPIIHRDISTLSRCAMGQVNSDR